MIFQICTKNRPGPCAPLAERPKVCCCRLNLLQPPRSVGPVGRGQAARTASRPSPPVVRRLVAAVAAAAVAAAAAAVDARAAVAAVGARVQLLPAATVAGAGVGA